jgi:hypothetical protein
LSLETLAVVAVVSVFLVAVSAIIVTNLVIFAMIGEINRKLPEDQLIPYFGFHPGRNFRIYGEYRRLYPKGNLHRWAIFLFASGVFSLLLVVLMAMAVAWRG